MPSFRMALGPPTVHRCAVRGLAFTGDGKNLLSTSADGITLVRPAPRLWEQSLDVLETWLQTAAGARFDG